jgi:hypothetical protein
MIKDFNKLSDDEVEKLLAERNKHKEKALIPKPLPYDKERHEKFVSDINDIFQEEARGEGKESEHWIFEATLQYVFGPKVFDAWNKFPNQR